MGSVHTGCQTPFYLIITSLDGGLMPKILNFSNQLIEVPAFVFHQRCSIFGFDCSLGFTLSSFLTGLTFNRAEELPLTNSRQSSFQWTLIPLSVVCTFFQFSVENSKLLQAAGDNRGISIRRRFHWIYVPSSVWPSFVCSLMLVCWSSRLSWHDVSQSKKNQR